MEPDPMPSSSARPDEIDRFDKLAAQWWDPAGPMPRSTP